MKQSERIGKARQVFGDGQFVKCPNCKGRGEIRHWGAFAQTVGCEDCAGTGLTPGRATDPRLNLWRQRQGSK